MSPNEQTEYIFFHKNVNRRRKVEEGGGDLPDNLVEEFEGLEA